ASASVTRSDVSRGGQGAPRRRRIWTTDCRVGSRPRRSFSLPFACGLELSTDWREDRFFLRLDEVADCLARGVTVLPCPKHNTRAGRQRRTPGLRRRLPREMATRAREIGEERRAVHAEAVALELARRGLLRRDRRPP